MYIVNSVLGDASGGRWQVVCDYARLLLARGHRVQMLIGERHRPDLSAVPPGAEIATIHSRGHYDLWAAHRLRRRYAAAPPDLAIAHCSRSVALLRRALGVRAPLLAVTHSTKVKRLLAADACVALTPAIARAVAAADPEKRCFVIPNMLEVDRTALPARQINRPIRLGALGRFDPVKGFDVFIDALGELQQRGHPFMATLGGDGLERRALEARARTRGLSARLDFPGWIEDVGRFLDGIDILCVPARSDAFGLTPLQAARAGVPLVLSTASGHLEMFAAEREALFADIGDAAATAAQLLRLADTPALAEGLRQAAFRKLSAEYSVEAVSDRIMEAIEITSR